MNIVNEILLKMIMPIFIDILISILYRKFNKNKPQNIRNNGIDDLLIKQGRVEAYCNIMNYLFKHPSIHGINLIVYMNKCVDEDSDILKTNILENKNFKNN